MGKDGTIFRFAAHENSVLCQIHEQLKKSGEKDKEELMNLIKWITKKKTKEKSKEIILWEGDRNIVDLLEVVKCCYYSLYAKESNSIKAILPAILNSSSYLQKKYSQPIYGTEKMISKNYYDLTWIKMENGLVQNPYKLLEPVFNREEDMKLDDLLMDDDSEVNDGGAAMAVYDKMQFTHMNDVEREKSMVIDLERMDIPDNRITVASALSLRFFHADKEFKTITPDLNASKVDLYNYRILNSDYSSLTNLHKQYEKNNIQVDRWIFNAANPELIPMDDVTNFEETVKEFKRMANYGTGSIGNGCYPSFKAAALKTHDFIDDAITLLGFDGIERLKYKVSNIKRKIVEISHRTSETGDVVRISKLLQLNTNFSTGSVLTCNYIKTMMNSYYNAIGIKKKATSKDMETYYHVEKVTKSVDGQQQRSVAILSPKITITYDFK